MFTDEQIKQFEKLLNTNNKQLRKELRVDIQASEERVKEELRGDMQASEKRVRETISLEVHDLTDFISELINRHEENRKKIGILEDKAGITSRKQ